MTASTFKNNPNIFALGSFEFDLQREFGKYFQVGAALVSSSERADLAVGFIDFHLLGGPIPARGNVLLESGFHLQVGRFDIPFGNDWQDFASLDRTTISAPLTTTLVMNGGYNDVGLCVLGNWSFLSYAAYLLKGQEKGFSLGGRLAFIPFNNPFTLTQRESQPLDVGFSYIHDFDQRGHTELYQLAVDLDARLSVLRVRAEYLRKHDGLAAQVQDGVHTSLFASFFEGGTLPFGFCGRFDLFRSRPLDLPGEQRINRLTASGYLRLFEVAVVKLEYFHYLKGYDSYEGGSVFAQLVIGFK